MDIVFGQISKFLEVSVDVVYFTFATKGPKLKATKFSEDIEIYRKTITIF